MGDILARRLGIIEGFFGEPWSWADRRAVVKKLAPLGYGFYIYAPKADAYLRKKWQEPYPKQHFKELKKFARHCKKLGVRVGIGLSPYEAYIDFDDDKKAALKSRLKMFDDIGIDDLAILFDDMKGDIPDLAQIQGEIMDFVRENTHADRLIMCPSYYSDSAILDEVFGQRPDNYLEDLGKVLHPDIEIFWTGEKVCSPAYSVEHLESVKERLGRKPFIWDNYPVNDGEKMSKFLHLRGFNNSAKALNSHSSGHAVNPALQARLSLVPAYTLAVSYKNPNTYSPALAFAEGAKKMLGVRVGSNIIRDVGAFQDKGLDGISDEDKKSLRARYAKIQSPAAREIVRWLDGKYSTHAHEAVLTQ